MSSIDAILNNLGVSPKESKIYMALLELGSGTIQEVAQKSGIKRTNVYNYIGEMKKKGLLNEVKQGDTTILIAEDPNNLVKRAQTTYKEVQSVLPELMSIFNLPGNKPKVMFYQGIEGIMRCYEDMVNSQDKYVYGFSDYEKMFESISAEKAWSIPAKRMIKGPFFMGIAKDGPRGREVKAKDKFQRRETVLIKDVNFETEVMIYDNKVLLVSFRRPYTGIIIEDRAIANTFRTVWKEWRKTMDSKKQEKNRA